MPRVRDVVMEKLDKLVSRLKKIDVEIKLTGNYPWIYLDSVNGNKVKEKFMGDHGFTVAFLPIRKGQELKLTDIKEIFKIIRKYKQL